MCKVILNIYNLQYNNVEEYKNLVSGHINKIKSLSNRDLIIIDFEKSIDNWKSLIDKAFSENKSDLIIIGLDNKSKIYKYLKSKKDVDIKCYLLLKSTRVIGSKANWILSTGEWNIWFKSLFSIKPSSGLGKS